MPERDKPYVRAGQLARQRRRTPEESGFKIRWLGWLVMAVVGCLALLGGVLLLEGIGFFRDIERAEKLIVVGWFVVAAVSIFVTMAVRMLRNKD